MSSKMGLGCQIGIGGYTFALSNGDLRTTQVDAPTMGLLARPCAVLKMPVCPLILRVRRPFRNARHARSAPCAPGSISGP